MGVSARRAARSLTIGAGISLLAVAALGGGVAPATAQEPVTLTIWSPENRPDDANAHNWLIEQFKAANPDINVEVTTTAWDDHFAKVDAAAAAEQHARHRLQLAAQHRSADGQGPAGRHDGRVGRHRRGQPARR